jgi:hypothetical protein
MDGMPMADLHDLRVTARVAGEPLPGLHGLRTDAALEHAGRLERHPDGRFGPVDALGVVVLSRLEPDRGDAAADQVAEHRAREFFFDAEHVGHGDLERHAAVGEGVVERGEGRSTAGGGVQVEDVDLALGFGEDARDLPVQLLEFPVLRLEIAVGGAYHRDVRGRPRAVEVGGNVAPPPGEGLAVACEPHEASLEAGRVALEVLEEPQERQRPGGFVAMDAAHDDQRGSRSLRADATDDAGQAGEGGQGVGEVVRVGPLPGGPVPGQGTGSLTLSAFDRHRGDHAFRGCRHIIAKTT